MNRGRTIRRIATSLTLGAIMTVLVAWSPPIELIAITPIARQGPGVKVQHGTPWPTEPPKGWPLAPQHVMRETPRRGSAVSFRAFDPPMVESNSIIDGTRLFVLRSERSGWPLRALVRYRAHALAMLIAGNENLGLYRQGWLLPPSWRSATLATDAPLPLMPVWSGFIINTLFYGALVFGAMVGIPAIKRRRRFKRGLCIQCAYPRTGGNLCPECGTAVRGAVKSPAQPAEPVGSTPV